MLRLSGYLGRLYERAGSALVCVMQDGTERTPCCWLEAGRIIDNRIGGRAPHGHNVGCTGSVTAIGSADAAAKEQAA